MGDTRTVLEHYNIDNQFPEAWPAENDDEDEREDAKAAPPLLSPRSQQQQNRRDRTKSRYSVLELTGGRSVSGGIESKAGKQRITQKDENDPLGKRTTIVTALKEQGLFVEDDEELRSRFLLSSTTFNPSAYLSQVHSRSSTQQLVQGLDFLSRSIEQKSASLKVLVESNFERFVRAKTTIDSVYTEMRNQGSSPAPEQQNHHRRSHSRNTSRASGPGAHLRSLSNQEVPQIQSDRKRYALVKESEYGLVGIKAPLMDVAMNAEDIWGPALGGRDREENLKTVLESFQRAQGVLELGGQISTSIRHKDYESLVRQYSRAKQYADDARSLADASARTGMALSDSEVHQLVITARMWLDVEEQIKNFKRDVWKELTSVQANLAMSTDKTRQDDHMTLIGVLLELGVEDNPIWLWLLSRYDYVRDRINATFTRSRMEIELLRRRLATAEKPTMQAMAIFFQSPSKAEDIAKHCDSPQVIEMWELIMHCMSRLLSVQGGVLGELLDFWEKTQSFIDGNAQKGLPTGVDGSSAKHHRLSVDGVRDLQSGVGELVDLMRDKLFAFFAEPPIQDISGLLSPMGLDSPKESQTPALSATATAGNGSQTPGLLSPLSAVESRVRLDGFGLPPSPSSVNPKEEYAFWPPHANSLSGVHYLGELLKLVGTASAELATIRPATSAQPTEKLKAFLNAARERCARAVIGQWKTDAELCKVLEDWTLSSDRAVTRMPARYAAFQGFVLSGLQSMLYMSEARPGRASMSEVVIPPPNKLISMVRSAFTSGLFATLSKFVENAEHAVDMQDAWAAGGITDETIDVTDKDLRMILTYSNIKMIQSSTVPALTSQFESDFSVTLTEERKSIDDTLSKISTALFNKYTTPLAERITATISRGISTSDWLPSTSRPTEVRPYVYDVLLQLVAVHTTVSSVAPNLVQPVLSHLLETISRALLDAFRKRARFPLAALMQATLDTEFTAQTLAQYSTELVSQTQSEIYVLLDQGTDARARDKLQQELGDMRATLKRLRDGTRSEFACFKKEKAGKAGGAK